MKHQVLCSYTGIWTNRIYCREIAPIEQALDSDRLWVVDIMEQDVSCMNNDEIRLLLTLIGDTNGI